MSPAGALEPLEPLGPAAPGPGRARRVVSLVPSLTGTVFALGAGGLLAGRTRYCVHPAEAAAVEAVGGTKDPDVARIVALAPDLVLANREENRREDVAALAARVPVLVTWPRTVQDSADLVAALGVRLGRGPAGAAIAARIRAARAAVEREGREPIAVVTLVWRRPYLAAGPDTYLSALLAAAGGVNPVPAGPSRYPEVEPAAIRALGADLVLLPDEPFRFGERHRQEAIELGLARSVELADGRLLTWWGATTAEGLPYAARLLARVRAGAAPAASPAGAAGRP